MKDEKPPSPTRGLAPQSKESGEGDAGAEEDAGDDEGSSTSNLADLIPRTDVR